MKKALTILLGAAVCALPAASSLAAVSTGDQAPGFTLTDSKGNEHSLSDFEGKYVVLEWINFGCPFVKKHYDSGNMQKLQKEFTGKDVVWLTICSSAPEKQGYMDGEEINKKLEEVNGAQTAYLIDEDGTVGRAYGAKVTPHMYVIAPDGTLIYQGGIDSIPSADQEDIAKATPYVVEAIEAHMKGEAVPNGTTQPYGCGVKY